MKPSIYKLSTEISDTLQISDVVRAFTAFYDTMRHSEHFKHFFESDEQMDALIGKQAQNFYDSLKMSEDDFKENYFQLGYRHAKMQLPIEDMFAGLMMIRDNLLKHVELPDSYLYLLIEQMENEIARGYFVHQAKDLIHQINISLHGFDESIPENHREMVKRPLIWLKNILENLERYNALNMINVSDVHQCPLTPLIKQLQVSDDILEQIHISHQDQHALGGSFGYFIQDHNYKLAGFILAKLSSISFSLSNQLSYAVSQELISALQVDKLSGLLLRHSLEDQFKVLKLNAKKEGWKMGVLLLDIDHFKQINDTYGHQAGDLVIEKIGQLLNQLKREGDLAYRYGGEEFLLIVTHLRQPTLSVVAERVRQAVEALEIEWQGTKIPITVSIGCHFLEDSEQPPEEELKSIIAIADKNLYQAKYQGRNQSVCSE